MLPLCMLTSDEKLYRLLARKKKSIFPAQRFFTREDDLILTYLKISNESCKISTCKENPEDVNQIYCEKEQTLFLHQIPFFFNRLSALNLIMAAWFCTHITGDNSYSNLHCVHLLIWWQFVSLGNKFGDQNLFTSRFHSTEG